MSITIVPAKKQHAIELAVFALDLVPIGNEQLKNLCEDVKRLGVILHNLTSVRPINHISLHVENSATSFVSDQGGFEFHDAEPSTKSKWSLSVNRDFVAVVCSDYDRWNPAKTVALSYLQPVFELLQKHSIELDSVALQYVDSFEVLGAMDKKDAVSAVLNIDNSEFFSPVLKSLPDFWHIHQGWFDKSQADTKLLNTLNVDFGASDGKNLVKIHGIHKNTLKAFSSAEKMKPLGSDIEPIFDELHQLNKLILNSILSEQSKDKIALNSSGG